MQVRNMSHFYQLEVSKTAVVTGYLAAVQCDIYHFSPNMINSAPNSSLQENLYHEYAMEAILSIQMSLNQV